MFVGRSTTAALLCCTLLTVLNVGPAAGMSLDRLRIDQNAIQAETPPDYSGQSFNANANANSALLVDDMELEAVPAVGNAEMFVLVPAGGASERDSVDRNVIESVGAVGHEEDAVEPANGSDMLMMESNDAPVMEMFALPPANMAASAVDIASDDSGDAIITNKMDKTPIEVLALAEGSAPSAPAETEETTASDSDDSRADGESESESVADLIADAVEEAEKEFAAEMAAEAASPNVEETVINEASKITADPIEKLQDDVLVNLIEKTESAEQAEGLFEDNVIDGAIEQGISDIIDDMLPEESVDSVVQAMVETSEEETDKQGTIVELSPEVVASKPIEESVATNNEQSSLSNNSENSQDSAVPIANIILESQDKMDEPIKEISTQTEPKPIAQAATVLVQGEKINSVAEHKDEDSAPKVETQVQVDAAEAVPAIEAEETSEDVIITEDIASQPENDQLAEESIKEETENEFEEKPKEKPTIEEAIQLGEQKLDMTKLSDTAKEEAVQSLDIIKEEIINEIEHEEVAEVEKDLDQPEAMAESQPEELQQSASPDSKTEDETDKKESESDSMAPEESQTVEESLSVQQEYIDSASLASEEPQTAEEAEEIKTDEMETASLAQEIAETAEETPSNPTEELETVPIVQDEAIKGGPAELNHQVEIEMAPVVPDEPHTIEMTKVDSAPVASVESAAFEDMPDKIETALDAIKVEQPAVGENVSNQQEAALSLLPIAHDEQHTAEGPGSVLLEETSLPAVVSEFVNEEEIETAPIAQDEQKVIEKTEVIKEEIVGDVAEAQTPAGMQEDSGSASSDQEEQPTVVEMQSNNEAIVTQADQTAESQNNAEVEIPQMGEDSKHDILTAPTDEQDTPTLVAAEAEQQNQEDTNEAATDSKAEAEVKPDEEAEEKRPAEQTAAVKPESDLEDDTANGDAAAPVPTQEIVDDAQQQQVQQTSEEIKPTSILTTIIQVPLPQQVASTVEAEPMSPTNAVSGPPATPPAEGTAQVPPNVMDSVLNYVNASFAQHNSQTPQDNAGNGNGDEVFSSKLRRYDGAQVWRILVQNDRDKRLADELQTKYDGQVWKEVKQEIDYLLKPQVLAEAARHIRAANLSRTVLIDNLQKVIEVENPSAAEIAQLQNRKGHRMTWQAYHRLDDIHGYFDYLAKTYPDICSVETIGYSVQKRPLKILKISNGNADNPGFWMDGGMHAREWISPASVTYIANQIVEGWDDLPPYMRNINWYMHAVANPDGYEYSHTTDRLWRKNMRSHGRQCPGVDLNRNFGFKWGGKGTSASPCAQTYRGSKAFSEPETFYISKFISNFPRDTFHAYISFHSYGQYILYPWGYDYHLTQDRSDLDRVARQAGTIITKTSGVKYTVGSSATTLYPAAGASDDWAKGFAGIKYTYTIEMGDTGRYGFVLPAKFIEYNGKDGYTFVETVARNIKLGNDNRKRAIHK